MPIVLLHLLFQIPAMITAGTLYRGLCPFELDAKLVPLFLVLSCLTVLFMPVSLALAFACALPVTIAYQYLGISLAKVVPFEVPEWMKTLPWPRRTQHIVYDVAGGSYSEDPMNSPVTDQSPDGIPDTAPPVEPPKKKSFIPDLP